MQDQKKVIVIAGIDAGRQGKAIFFGQSAYVVFLQGDYLLCLASEVKIL